MSYDLYFYKRENNPLLKNDIVKFLHSNLEIKNESEDQWFIENGEAETYYAIEHNDPSGEDTDEKEYPGFRNTNFAFNINYMRPDYFGQEAFPFIDKMIEALDLYVFNPQGSGSDEDIYKPEKSSLYRNWSEINAGNCRRFFDEYGLLYFPPEKSNYIYKYRKSRQDLWSELGDDYYVSKSYIDVLPDKTTATLALLPLETAVVVPKSNFYLMTALEKKWFKTVEQTGLISHDTFTQHLSHLFENYKFPDSKILKAGRVAEAQKIYNTIPFDHERDYSQRADIQKISNFRP